MIDAGSENHHNIDQASQEEQMLEGKGKILVPC